MKKYFAIFALATLTLVACDKVKETFDDSNDVTTIHAVAADNKTKTTVSGLFVYWSAGDHVAVADEDGTMVNFELTAGAGNMNATFQGELNGKALGDYAVYPYSATPVAGHSVTTDYPTTWTYGTTIVPMWGKNNGDYEFHNVGGAVKVSYSNVPSTTNAKYFVLTGNKNITGPVTVSNLDSTPSVDASAMTGNTVTVTGIPNDATSVSVVVPVPAGTGYNFTAQLKEETTNTLVPGSEKTATGKAITTNRIAQFPDVDLTPVITASPLSFSIKNNQASSGHIITYNISNVATSAKVTATTSNATITIDSTTDLSSGDGTVSFTVAKKYTAGTITLSYPGADPVVINVIPS